MVYKVIVDFYNIKKDTLDSEVYQMDEKPTKEWIKSLNQGDIRVDGVHEEEIWMKKNWFQVLDKKQGKIVPYQGGPNFNYDPIKCNNCGGVMIKTPLGSTFLKFTTGCLIVDIRKGIMHVNNGEVDHIYACQTCPNAINPELV